MKKQFREMERAILPILEESNCRLVSIRMGKGHPKLVIQHQSGKRCFVVVSATPKNKEHAVRNACRDVRKAAASLGECHV